VIFKEGEEPAMWGVLYYYSYVVVTECVQARARLVNVKLDNVMLELKIVYMRAQA
jgi:hypothetical protein